MKDKIKHTRPWRTHGLLGDRDKHAAIQDATGNYTVAVAANADIAALIVESVNREEDPLSEEKAWCKYVERQRLWEERMGLSCPERPKQPLCKLCGRHHDPARHAQVETRDLSPGTVGKSTDKEPGT